MREVLKDEEETDFVQASVAELATQSQAPAQACKFN